MSADWYTVSGAPGEGANLVSATMRAEFALIEAALDKLPTMTGAGDELVKVNAGGTALETVASLTVPLGGTGAATLTDGGILLGNGTSAVEVTARPNTGEVLVGQGAGSPALQSGATLRTSLGLGTTDSPTLAGLTLGVTPLAVGSGGTGAATLTDGGILLGSGTSAVTVTARPTLGQVLVGQSSGDPVLMSGDTLRGAFGLATDDDPTFAGLTLTTPLPAGSGGTGQATLGAGHVLIGNGAGDLLTVDVTAKGSILVGDGSGAPSALAVGTNDHVLTADSTQATGLKWAAVGGIGGVGTMTSVKSDGSTVGDDDIATLDFSAAFSITESPDTEVNIDIVDAATDAKGIIEIATQGEVNTSDGARAVTGETLAGYPGSTNWVTVGTISSGVWEGTAVDVAHGGTGKTSLSSGRVLLGNGTGDVAELALGDGEVMVGQLAAAPIAMGGATFRAALGIVNNVTHSGDASGASVLTIGSNVVSNTKLADMATSTIKGRVTAGTGDPEDLTATQVRTLLNVEDGATADMSATEIRTALLGVDGAGSGVDADLLDGQHGSYYVPKGAYTTSGLTMDSARILARSTGGNGAAEQVTVGHGLSLASGSLAVAMPSGKLYRSAAWSPGSGTTVVPFDFWYYNNLTKGAFTTGSSARYTSTNGGRILFTAALHVTDLDNLAQVEINVRLNGSTVIARGYFYNRAGATLDAMVNASSTTSLSATEYIDVVVILGGASENVTEGVGSIYLDVVELS